MVEQILANRIQASDSSCQRENTAEDDLDIVEMTPTPDHRTDPNSSLTLNKHSLPGPPTVLSLKLQTFDKTSSSSCSDTTASGSFHGPDKQTPISHQKLDPQQRDPSNNIESNLIQIGSEPNVLANIVGNISRVFSSHTAGDTGSNSPCSVLSPSEATPIASKDKFQHRPSETSASPPSPRVIGLHDGEDQGLRNQPLFKGANDPSALDFAAYLKEDGAAPRIPVLCMSDYGIGEYATDLWALPHNAIKRELFDLYEIIGVIRLRYLSLTFGDFYNLRLWWRLFGVFLLHYLKTETTLLDPLIKTVVGVDGRGQTFRKKTAPLMEIREWVACKFEEISGYVEEFETLPRGRALSLICRTVDALGFKLMMLFNQEERCLPQMVESYHDESIKLNTELKLVENLRASEFFPELLVHQIRWMDAGKSRDHWLSTHLRWTERSNMSRFYKRYEVNHGQVVVAFRNKLRS